MSDQRRRPRANAPGTNVPLPSIRPLPESDPPAPPSAPPDHTGALLRESRRKDEKIEELREGMRRYEAILQEARLGRVAKEAEPKGHAIPQWAAILVAVLTAIGATGGWEVVKSIREKPTARPEEIVRVETECRERFDTLASYVAGFDEDQKRRDAAQNATLCKLNGGAVASGLECKDDACEAPALSNGKIVPGQPICKAKKAWPPRRQPPKPTEDE